MTSIAIRVPRASVRTERTVEQRRLRRVQWVWALLFLDVLSFQGGLILPIPHFLGQLVTQGALVLALILALSANPRVKIRPSIFLVLYTVLGIITLMMSVRFVGLGTTYRSFRLIGFLAVLWLLTPWWGRRDLLLLRVQMRVLVAVLISTLIGLVLSPGKAIQFNAGARRLGDIIWPIPATQLGHYMAELIAITAILWLCRIVSRRLALLLIVPGITTLVLTHTRTALLAMLVGLVVASLSLFTASRRVRKMFLIAVLLGVTVMIPLSPFVSAWLVRGESTSEVSSLSGRTNVWPAVLSEPRPETNKILGSGLSNDSVVGAQDPTSDGLPIDSSWISNYQDQGIVGMALDGLTFLILLIAALLRPRGPSRAIALFLIVYCLIASFTETGMGGASTYLLDLTLAASLIALPLARPALVERRSLLAEPPTVKTPGFAEVVRKYVPAIPPNLDLRQSARSATAQVAAAGAWGFGGRVALLLANLLATPFIIRLLGPSRYGMWTLLMTSLMWASLAAVGMGSASTKYGADYFAEGDDRGESSVVWSALGLVSLTVTSVAVVLWFAAPTIVSQALRLHGPLLQGGVLGLRLICAVLVIQTITSIINTPQQVRLRARASTIIISGAMLVTTIGAPIALYLWGGGVVTMSEVWLAGAVIAALGTFLLAARLQPAVLHVHVNRQVLCKLLRFGTAIMIANLALVPLSTGQQFFLARDYSTTTVAFYAVAATLATTLLILPEQLTMPLVPAFARLQSGGRLEEHRDLYKKSLVGLFVLVTPAAIILALIARPFFSVWAGPAYGLYSTGPFIVILIGVWANSLSGIPYAYLMTAGKTNVIAWTQVGQLVPYIVAAWILTAKFGVIGAAAVWSVRLVADTVICFWVVRRVDPSLPIAPLSERKWRAVLAPVALACAALFCATLGGSLVVRLGLGILLGVTYFACTWVLVLTAKERKTLVDLARELSQRRGGRASPEPPELRAGETRTSRRLGGASAKVSGHDHSVSAERGDHLFSNWRPPDSPLRPPCSGPVLGNGSHPGRWALEVVHLSSGTATSTECPLACGRPWPRMT